MASIVHRTYKIFFFFLVGGGGGEGVQEECQEPTKINQKRKICKADKD